MSINYQPFLQQDLGAVVQLPLEELTADPLNNIGSLAGSFTGTHTNTLEQQVTLISGLGFSMGYPVGAKTVATNTAVFTARSWSMVLEHDGVDGVIFSMADGLVPSTDEIRVAVFENKLVIQSKFASINTLFNMFNGNVYSFAFVYLENSNELQLYYGGNLESTFNLGLLTTQFKDLYIHDLPPAIADCILLNETSDNLVSETGNTLTTVC